MYIRRILFILHYVVEVQTTQFQSDSVPRLISFTAERFEYNESSFYELNCSSSRQSMENGAEFIIDGKTVEHIVFHKNKCYDSKQKECTLDHCQCVPRDNVYIHKHKYRNKHTERIIGCQMRFAINATGGVIKAVLSIRINETTIQTHAYQVKILQKHKENNREDENEASFAEKITEWMPLLFCLLLMNIVCFIVVLWCHARSMTRRDSLHLLERSPHVAIEFRSITRRGSLHLDEMCPYVEIGTSSPRHASFPLPEMSPYEDIPVETSSTRHASFPLPEMFPYEDIPVETSSTRHASFPLPEMSPYEDIPVETHYRTIRESAVSAMTRLEDIPRESIVIEECEANYG